MSDPFASALDAIFHGPGSEAAEIITIYGQHIADVRIIRSKADRSRCFVLKKIRLDNVGARERKVRGARTR